MKHISCNAPYGEGGLGQHFAQIIEDARAGGDLGRYYAYRLRPGDEDLGVVIAPRPFQLLGRYTPLRLARGWRSFVLADLFDRTVAARLEGPVDTFVGFGGRALRCFARARAMGARRLDLVAANSHVDNVARRHAEARARYGLEPGWLDRAQHRKTLREYDRADLIYVASAYTERSFVEAGVPEEKLRRVRYDVDPRFRPPAARPGDGIFRIVYVGSLTTAKGVPVLVDAFSRLPLRRAELTLVGTWSSRGMRRYLSAQMARDPRIRVRAGDPLPSLHRADIYVHPSFEDGFAYAPMEALACGVPVVVTEDTGMKEHVREGENGYVVPTGDVEALLQRLLHLHARPLPGPFP